MTDNWQRAVEHLDLLTNPHFLSAANLRISEIEAALLPLSNKKAGGNTGKQEIKGATQAITGVKSDKKAEERFNGYLETAMTVGASLFSTALHLKVARFVLQNVDFVAQAGIDLPAWKQLKTEPTLKNYMELAAQGGGGAASVSLTPTKSLADLLTGLSSDEDE